MSNSRVCAHSQNPPLQHHTGKEGSMSNMTHCVYAVLLDAVSIDVKSAGEKNASGVTSNTAAVLPVSALRDCTTDRSPLP
jgi:hypothetical protein